MAIIPYNRISNLQNDQALHPSDPYPANTLDQEYNAVKITTDDIIQHLDLIQNDDGTLANDSVGRDQIQDDLLLGFTAPFQWVTQHDYIYANTVFNQNSFWFCRVAHRSGDFVADVNSGYWELLANFNDAATTGAKMYVGDGPPPLPVQGQQWFEADTGNHYVFYVDASGPTGQWVQL